MFNELNEKNGINESEVMKIVDKALTEELLTKEEMKLLFEIPHKSAVGSYIQCASRKKSEALCQGKAEIHGQLGINIGACPKNCQFCSLAACNKMFPEASVLPVDEIIRRCVDFEEAGANAIYLMTTANFSMNRFVEIAYEVRKRLQKESILVANIGDFNEQQATMLKEAGIDGVYHAVRMGEGVTTGIKPEMRLQSYAAARKAGLVIGNCVEPVGPEHTINELVEKTIIAREARPVFSGAMRRTQIEGTPLSQYGMLTEGKMAHIVAVVRLAMGTNVMGNCTHEPNVHGAVAGANLLWAEVGANPRDTKEETQDHRGFSVARLREIYWEADWEVLTGPSQFFKGVK